MNFPDAKLSRHWLFLSFLALYGALLLSQLNHGLASGDAHGIVRTTQALVESHRLEVSRPPGHPTTEFYVFGAAGWFLKQGFGHKFDDQTYLVLQSLAALATLVVFYELLCRLGTKRWRALLATLCLAFSAQYFSNAIDGEEFNFALLFLLISVRLLIVPSDSASARGRLFLSIFCFALATGCRPEIVFAGLIFPTYCLLHPKLGWKYAIATLPIQVATIFLIWQPVILIGIKAPYTVGMNLRESILGGGYRLILQCFTPPVFVLLCWILIHALRDWRKRIKDSFPSNFVFVASCLIPLIFLIVFFRYPSKPAYMLVVVPFLLLIAIERSSVLLLTLTAATLIGCVVNIDIFKDRQLARPFLIPGSYFQAAWQKPYYKLAYLRELPRQCEDRPTVIIANAAQWDVEYHLARGGFSAREEILTDTNKPELAAFFPQDNDACILLPRDGAYETRLFENWKSKGYTFKMDALLYRTLFARYNVTASLTNSASLGDISFSLFSIK
jgi:hypothetical protein